MTTSLNPDINPSSHRASLGFRVPFVRPMLPSPEALQPQFKAILQSGWLTNGPYVEQLEDSVASRLGVRHAVAVSSCTAGLMLTYRAIDRSAGSCRNRRSSEDDCAVAGLERLSRFGVAKSGDRSEAIGEVIVPSFTFIAAPAAIVWNNLRPVFVDVDPQTTNISPQHVAAAITERTVAISACHNFGNPCDLAALEAIADEHRLPLVIDAAHGFGASMHGRPVGAGATAQVFSLSPTKLLVSGEGGIVATDCDCVAHFVRLGREYGNDGTYNCVFPGLNARMPELSAALALQSLDILDEVSRCRNETAAAYRRELADLPGIDFVQIQPGAVSSYKDLSIRIDPKKFGMTRDGLRRVLAANGIETRAYFTPACHRQTAFEHFHDRTTPLPATDLLSAQSVSLPIGAHVDGAVVREICDIVANAKQFA